MMKYSQVHSPMWANADRTAIDCYVKFDALKMEVPFTASPADCEAHGREIFQRCLNGEFGNISDYKQVSQVRVGDDTSMPPGWPDIHKFLEQANAENRAGTVRGIVLVWSSMIENLLSDLLCSFLIDHRTAKDISKDFQASRAATLCFALGLISANEHHIIKKIQKVRNEISHSWNVSLESPDFARQVKPAIKALFDADHSGLYNWNDRDLIFMIRHFYTSSCARLVMKIAERIADTKAERRTQRPD